MPIPPKSLSKFSSFSYNVPPKLPLTLEVHFLYLIYFCVCSFCITSHHSPVHPTDSLSTRTGLFGLLGCSRTMGVRSVWWKASGTSLTWRAHRQWLFCAPFASAASPWCSLFASSSSSAGQDVPRAPDSPLTLPTPIILFPLVTAVPRDSLTVESFSSYNRNVLSSWFFLLPSYSSCYLHASFSSLSYLHGSSSFPPIHLVISMSSSFPLSSHSSISQFYASLPVFVFHKLYSDP